MNKIDLNAGEILVFHGTNELFEKFDDSKIDQVNSDSVIGHWFVDNLGEAVNFCNFWGGSVKAVALTLRNISYGLNGDNFGSGQDATVGRKFREDAIAKGEDGAAYGYGDFTYYVAFHGTQARIVAELSPQQAMFVHELVENAGWPEDGDLVNLFNENIEAIDEVENDNPDVSVIARL